MEKIKEQERKRVGRHEERGYDETRGGCTSTEQDTTSSYEEIGDGEETPEIPVSG